jgi:CRISPR-associated exonuclease Cas4
MCDEDDLLQISGLQHASFCERRWGLVHLENIWAENVFTVEGKILHERADTPETEVRGNLRIARGLRLRSLRLGLTGKADVVEFHRLLEADEKPAEPDGKPSGVRLEGVPGLWRPVPVEYKRGYAKADFSDEAQLCAQALCLEEMLNVTIPSGALFYGKPRRRYEIRLDDAPRRKTETLAARLHELYRAGSTARARYEKKCDHCSLSDFCLPKTAASGRSAKAYLSASLAEIADGSE